MEPIIITRDIEEGIITIGFENDYVSIVARRDGLEVGFWSPFEIIAFQIWHKKYVKNKDVSDEPLKHIGVVPLYADDVEKIHAAIIKRNEAFRQAKEEAVPGVFALEDLYIQKAQIFSAVERSEEDYPRAKAYLRWKRIEREAKETGHGGDEGYAASYAAEALEEGKSLEEAQTIMENILSERRSGIIG
jgi:hypothetical protein